jgi:hypothetical protein
MIRSFISFLLAIVLLGGCAANVNKIGPDLSLRKNCTSILLMPMDIELSALTAGGVLEPNAEWTANAKQFILDAINSKFATRNIALLSKEKTAGVQLDAKEEKLRTQLIKLHEVVGRSILVHQYMEPLRLPNKNGKLDWTLGEKAGFLQEKFGADYALFVYLRDSYVTAGRVAMMFVAAAFGYSMPGGAQVGFASLVDLNTGQVVWFNRLMRGTGDLRNREDAVESVAALLADFPS